MSKIIERDGKKYVSVNPDWLYVGQEVWISAQRHVPNAASGTGLKCKVEVARGDAGIVSNEQYGVRELVDRYDMYVLREVKSQTAS